MPENLQWEKKDKIGLAVLAEQLDNYSKLIVEHELKDLVSKLDMLGQMGIVKDTLALDELKNKVRNFSFKGIEK